MAAATFSEMITWRDDSSIFDLLDAIATPFYASVDIRAMEDEMDW
jgi:hypothetical protein